MHTKARLTLRSCPPVFHILPAIFGIDSSIHVSVRRPNVGRDSEDYSSLPLSPRRVAEHAECTFVSSSLCPPVVLRSLYPRTDAAFYASVGGQLSPLTLASEVSHRVDGLLRRLGTAGFHGRLRVSCVWSLFFPRSVGLGPTASSAKGAFTSVPSMLCQDQAMPSISSYSAKPFLHILMKTPARFHSRKYLCTELALPYSFGNAFHWHPVRRTYTIPSKTRRGAIAFRPPPDRRLYRTPLTRLLTFGIRGAKRSHSASDTVQDLSVLMRRSITQSISNGNNYLRISS